MAVPSAAASAVAATAAGSAASQSPVRSTLRVVSWNLDGMSSAGLARRTQAAAHVLQSLSPPADLVLLQEVTLETLELLAEAFELNVLSPEEAFAATGAPAASASAAATASASSSATSDRKRKKRERQKQKRIEQKLEADIEADARAADEPQTAAAVAALMAKRQAAAAGVPTFGLSKDWILIAPPEAYARVCGYFVVALIRGPASPLKLGAARYHAFERSVMDRHVLRMSIGYFPRATPPAATAAATAAAPSVIPLHVCTSHLESLRGGAEFRIDQLLDILSGFDAPRAGAAAVPRHALLAGDLNLRDYEVDALQPAAADASATAAAGESASSRGRGNSGPAWRSFSRGTDRRRGGGGAGATHSLRSDTTDDGDGSGDTMEFEYDPTRLGRWPAHVRDAWEVAGRPSEARYTWDLKRNHNQRLPTGAPRLRFDRALYTLPHFRQTAFALIGTQRLSELAPPFTAAAAAATGATGATAALAPPPTAPAAADVKIAPQSLNCAKGHPLQPFGAFAATALSAKATANAPPVLLDGKPLPAQYRDGFSCDHCTQSFPQITADALHCVLCGDYDLCASCAVDMQAGRAHAVNVDSLFPSDHFGIVIDFEYDAKSAAAAAAVPAVASQPKSKASASAAAPSTASASAAPPASAASDSGWTTVQPTLRFTRKPSARGK